MENIIRVSTASIEVFMITSIEVYYLLKIIYNGDLLLNVFSMLTTSSLYKVDILIISSIQYESYAVATNYVKLYFWILNYEIKNLCPKYQGIFCIRKKHILTIIKLRFKRRSSNNYFNFKYFLRYMPRLPAISQTLLKKFSTYSTFKIIKF